MSIFDSLNKFIFLRPLSGSYNISFIIKKNITRSIWVAKFSRKLPNLNFVDLNQRALLAYRLSKLIDTCIPETKIIRLNNIEYSENFIEFLKTIPDELVKDNTQISRFKGITIADFLKVNSLNEISNLNEVLENFVFNLWIGNYDKKNGDYVIDQNNKIWSIDYNLLGPGFEDNSLSLGGYARSYSYNNIPDSGWCIGETFIEYLREKNPINIFDEAIARIESLRDEKIGNSFKGLSFYKAGTSQSINDIFIDFLIERKKTIREKVNLWIQGGYPRR